MKFILAFLLIYLSLSAFSQTRSKYDFDLEFLSASRESFSTTVEKKDSLWYAKKYYIHLKRLQMQGSFKDKECENEHGHFSFFHPNGAISSQGIFINGKKEGVWRSYYSNKMLKDSAFYINGKIAGTKMHWYSNGNVADSSVWKEDESGVFISWFDNGMPSSGGMYAAGKKLHGKWRFFHKNGKPSAIEAYDKGKLLSAEYFDESGNRMDSALQDKRATFPGGSSNWRRYLEKNLKIPNESGLISEAIVVVVNAVVDEDGNVSNVEVSIPGRPAYNESAVNVMANSIKWIPAISHNRRVVSAIRQQVNFFIAAGSP